MWVSDHVFNVGYVFERIGDKPYYDPLTVLSYVAATTKRIKLGTSVLVLPYYNPIRLAKTTATLDVISGGRLTLGVGVGVIEQEFDALGSPFAERGAVTNETIAIMKELWTQEDPSYQGKYYRFPAMKFSPKPIQKPHVPLLIGGGVTGHLSSAIQRAVQMGNGWHPSSMSPEALSQGIQFLRERCEAAGRDPLEVPVSMRIDMAVPSTPKGYQPERYWLGQESREILHNASAFRELGVESLVISPATGDTEEISDAMEVLAREVLPKFQTD